MQVTFVELPNLDLLKWCSAIFLPPSLQKEKEKMN